jgi:hypothetical protein
VLCYLLRVNGSCCCHVLWRVQSVLHACCCTAVTTMCCALLPRHVATRVLCDAGCNRG